MSLLLMFGGASGSVTITPIAFGPDAAILVPDEVAAGGDFTVLFEVFDENGLVALDSAPQIAVYQHDAFGVRSTAVPLAYMSATSDDSWSATLSLDTVGVYVVACVGEISSSPFSANAPLTVRSKFDGIGLAIDDVLVSRMDGESPLMDI